MAIEAQQGDGIEALTRRPSRRSYQLQVTHYPSSSAFIATNFNHEGT